MIYRAIGKENYSTKIINHLKTKRVPSNIPYVVDNILEWLRPHNMPSRRTAVFASNSKELAFMYSNNNEYICSVRFENEKNSKVVQIKGYDDAKLHPDIKNLAKVVLDYLKKDYLESSLSEKEKNDLFKIFIPILSKDEIEEIIPEDLKSSILKISTFWKDTVFINVEGNEYKESSGEIFFHAQDGYYLDLLN